VVIGPSGSLRRFATAAAGRKFVAKLNAAEPVLEKQNYYVISDPKHRIKVPPRKVLP
jgi:hypothetical protein